MKTCDVNYLWINGVKESLEENMHVVDPSTSEIIGSVPNASSSVIDKAIQSATDAFSKWSHTTGSERSVYLFNWADRIDSNRAELAELLSREQGKPLAEAKGEITGTAIIIRWFAEEGKRVYGEILPSASVDQQLLVMKKPVGPVAVITPANVPAAILANEVAPALAAGCTFVLKPADQTPLIALKLMDLLMETHLPAGVANVVTGEGSRIGEQLVKDKRIRKVAFTGSTKVGKEIASEASIQMKRLTLELGGNAPAIIFDDANVDKAVTAIINNKFENCGQVCNGINVVYVHNDIHKQFVEKLKQHIQRLTLNKGINDEGNIGPMIDNGYVSKVEELVQDAVNKGAEPLLGGYRPTHEKFKNGFYYMPTLLDRVKQNMKITQTEVFGPVLPIVSFETEEEIIKTCNKTPYGLAAYVYTRSTGRIYRFMDQLEFGNIGINGTSLAYPQAPFGGWKESGVGRVGGKEGLEEYLELKYVALTPED